MLLEWERQKPSEGLEIEVRPRGERTNRNSFLPVVLLPEGAETASSQPLNYLTEAFGVLSMARLQCFQYALSEGVSFGRRYSHAFRSARNTMR